MLMLTWFWPALQYSFGVLLYELITGKRAWAGMTHVQVGDPRIMHLSSVLKTLERYCGQRAVNEEGACACSV